MIDYLFFVLGFLFLIKGAEFLVSGASNLARHLKVSELFIGLTVVAFGTSLPELIVNISASSNSQVGLAVANILGSNISNILLILGVASVIYPLSFGKEFWKHSLFSFFSVVLLLVFFVNNSLNLIFGIFVLVSFAFYLLWSFKQDSIDVGLDKNKVSVFNCILFAIAGSFMLMVGGNWVVNGAVVLSEDLGISSIVVGLILVAVGTSLPELVTAIVAAKQKKTEMVVGEIIGSNIFNILFILGVTSFISSLNFEAKNIFSLYFLLAISFCFFVFTLFRKEISFKTGILFLVVYVGYVCYLFL